MQVQVTGTGSLEEMNGMDGMNGNYRKVVEDCEHLADQATYEFKKARIIDRNVTVSVSHLLRCGEVMKPQPSSGQEGQRKHVYIYVCISACA